MKRTNAENQAIMLKKKIKSFFTKTVRMRKLDLCPVKNILATSLDKWSLFVLYNLGYNQTMRFNELKNRIDKISSRMLSLTLKRLEQNNLVNRKVYAEVPPKVEYSLTPLGRGFTDRVIDLSQWFIDQSEVQNQCNCMNVEEIEIQP